MEKALGLAENSILQDYCNIDPAEPEPPRFGLLKRQVGRIRGKGKNSAASHVAKTIEEKIQEGIYQEKIPPQKELIIEFGYDRTTIHFALKMLQEKGLIQSEKKRGTRIIRESTS